MSEKTAAYWYQRIAEDVAELGFVDPSRYEVRFLGDFWKTPEKDTLLWMAEQRPDLIRHKPRRITISGPGGEYSYPEPMKKAPGYGTGYWCPVRGLDTLAAWHKWTGRDVEYERLRRGGCHESHEAAREHAIAEICAAGFEP